MNDLNPDLPTVTAALRKAEAQLSMCFVWSETPEGHDYWEAQSTHLLALANQIEDNPAGYAV